MTNNRDEILWTLLRISTGAVMVPHGAQKLFGMFGSPGWERLGEIFETQAGLVPGVPYVLFIGSVELLAGLGLMLGVFTRLSAFGCLSVLVGAMALVNINSGFFWTRGGIEYPLIWSILCFCFVIRGGGAYSVPRMVLPHLYKSQTGSKRNLLRTVLN